MVLLVSEEGRWERKRGGGTYVFRMGFDGFRYLEKAGVVHDVQILYEFQIH